MAITTTIQIAKDSGFEQLVYNETAEDSAALSRAINCDTSSIPYGVQLHARMKHNNDGVGYRNGCSSWSKTVRFSARQPAQIIGVCLRSDGFYWIDADGNQVSSFDYRTHPIWAESKYSTFDASRSPVTMTSIPTVYCKTQLSGMSGTFANGCPCWWVSDHPYPGFHPHPAFKRSTQTDSSGKYLISDWNHIGTYMGHNESISGTGNTFGSKKGAGISTGVNCDTAINYMYNRNNPSYGQDGWRPYDVYDWGLLKLLAIIAHKTGDMRSKFGEGRPNVVPTNYPTGATNAKYPLNPSCVVDDAWNVAACYLHLFQPVAANPTTTFALTSPMNHSSDIWRGSCPISLNNMGGFWSTSVTIGNDTHDTLELLLPGSQGRSMASWCNCSMTNNCAWGAGADYRRGHIAVSGLAVGSSNSGVNFFGFYALDSYTSSDHCGSSVGMRCFRICKN